MKKTFIFTVLAIIFAMVNSLAQDTLLESLNKFELNRSIILNASSEKKEIPLNITPTTGVIVFEMDCELKYNELTIEIIDPTGKKIGSFSVENMDKQKNVKGQTVISSGVNLNSKYSETVRGQLRKRVPAIVGKWKVIILPKNKVLAKINIKTTQYLKE